MKCNGMEVREEVCRLSREASVDDCIGGGRDEWTKWTSNTYRQGNGTQCNGKGCTWRKGKRPYRVERPWCWVWTGLEIGNGSTCSYSSSICGNTIERPSDMPNQDIKSVWANSISNMVRLTLLVLVGYVARSLCSLPIFLLHHYSYDIWYSINYSDWR